MSEAVERRLVEVLEHPTTSPYGNPIPGLSELGHDGPTPAAQTLVRLSEVSTGGATAVVVRRIAEHVQTDVQLMAQLREAGVVPDARVTVEGITDGVRITASGHAGAELPAQMAHAVQVERIG